MSNKKYLHATFVVIKPIPSNVPNHERSWFKWRPQVQTMGALNIAELREHLKEKYPDHTEIKETIREVSSPYFEESTSNVWAPTHYKLKSFGTSVTTRGTMGDPMYSCEEYAADAKIAVAEARAEGMRRQDSYYSQAWV